MKWEGELAGVAVFVTASVVLVVLLECWVRCRQPRPEVGRKMLHLVGIIPCLFIPVLIESTWVALGLTLMLTAGLWAGARFGLLHSVSDVPRGNHGAVYYPVAIFGVFLLAGDRTWMFLSALFALGVADAFAALIGSAYGKFRYEVEDDEKSVEGSAVFFAISFVAVALPLLLMADLPWPNCLLAALLTAFLVTGFEAISLNGFDNLFVPIGVCIVLDRIVDLAWGELLAKNLLFLGLLIGAGLLVRFTRHLSGGAAIVFALFTYAAAALANWHWALAPVIGLALYLGLRMTVPPPRGYRTRVKVVIFVRILIPALLLLGIASATGEYGLLQGPYVACFAATVYFSLRVYLGWQGALQPGVHFGLAAVAGLVIGTLVATPLWLLEHASIHGLVAISATCVLLAVVHELTLPREGSIEEEEFWTAPKFVLSCSAALVIVALQGLNLIPSWPEPRRAVTALGAGFFMKQDAALGEGFRIACNSRSISDGIALHHGGCND